MHGSDDLWIDVPFPDKSSAGKGAAKKTAARAWFRFQYKGLYPALEEAARLSPAMRGKLDHLVDRSGMFRVRRQPPARRCVGRAAARADDGRIRPPAAGRFAAELAAWELTAREKQIAGELIREVRTRVQFLVDVGLEYLIARPPGADAFRRRIAANSAWPARWAAGCAACCTCSTSRRSACTRATIAGCSPHSKSSATWATRC